MEITYKTISKLWEHPTFQNAGFDYADEYGEPGYSLPYGASNDVCVLLANWNLIGDKYPRLMAALGDQGFQLEWCDEWIISHDSSPSKCYRTQPDSYSWQSSILWTDGDFLTPDDGIDAWIEEVVDQPRRCLPSNVWNAANLREAGFVQWMPDDPQHYESGWHPGQTDDPEAITAEIRATAGYEEGRAEVVFLLDEASQFYVGFSAWTRRETDDNDEETDMDDEYISSCPACGQPIDYCQGHGEMGDPEGFRVLAAHDDGDHADCHPDGCEEAGS